MRRYFFFLFLFPKLLLAAPQDGLELCAHCGDLYRVHTFKIAKLETSCTKIGAHSGGSLYKVTLKTGGVLEIYSDYLTCSAGDELERATNFVQYSKFSTPYSSEQEDRCSPRIENPNGGPLCWVYNIDFKPIQNEKGKFELVQIQIYPNRDYTNTVNTTEQIIEVGANGIAHLNFPYKSDQGIGRVYVAGDFNHWDERANRMQLNGNWFLDLPISPGTHKIRFLEVALYRIIKPTISIQDEIHQAQLESGNILSLQDWFKLVAAPPLNRIPLWLW